MALRIITQRISREMLNMPSQFRAVSNRSESPSADLWRSDEVESCIFSSISKGKKPVHYGGYCIMLHHRCSGLSDCLVLYYHFIFRRIAEMPADSAKPPKAPMPICKNTAPMVSVIPSFSSNWICSLSWLAICGSPGPLANCCCR